MWPFTKKAVPSLPDRVWSDGTVARYNAKMKFWWFVCDEIEFFVSRESIDESALEHANEAVRVIRGLGDPLRQQVLEVLGDWPCDKSKAHVSTVNLTKFPESRTIEVGFVGDVTWGDFGVDVVITDGKIIKAYGGD